MNAFEAAAADGREAELQAELEALFNGQNASPSEDATSIPATFLRVTAAVPGRDQLNGIGGSVAEQDPRASRSPRGWGRRPLASRSRRAWLEVAVGDRNSHRPGERFPRTAGQHDPTRGRRACPSASALTLRP